MGLTKGNQSGQEWQTFILSWENQEMGMKIKTEILQKAKRLKGSCNWPSLVITHDLTKIQCLEEKNHELKLRRDVEMMSASLTSMQRQTK